MTDYREVQKRLACGWNTWDTRSVLSQVLLPDALRIRLSIKNYASSSSLTEAYVLRHPDDPEDAFNQAQVQPGPHTYDGSYTRLQLTWQSIVLDVRSAHDGDDVVILVEPVAMTDYPATLVTDVGILYNRPGYTSREKSFVRAVRPGKKDILVYCSAKERDEPNHPVSNPYFACSLTGPICIATGRERSVVEARDLLDKTERELAEHARTQYGERAELYEALRNIVAWDTIYEPKKDRICTPVSRKWNMNWGGYVLFDWDTYFAGWMASVDNPDLAVANIVEITHEKSKFGFIPNFGGDENNTSDDRSQPPVGAFTTLAVYRKLGPDYAWLIQEVYDDLLAWNRWWVGARQVQENLLAWGCSEKQPSTTGHWAVSSNYSDLQGAMWESGLDNSPMYDDVPFDTKRRVLPLADVGLTALYVADCRALAELAGIIGKDADQTELQERANAFEQGLTALWNENDGIFQNRRTDTGRFSGRLSPTLFYPLLSGSATDEQARIMIREHFFNPNEFWGTYIMPSIARNDPAYPDQDYWRGRIWAPMNFLVYLGLRKYDLPDARKAMVEKSADLLLKEWREDGHIHENYNGDTGAGCDVTNSDSFYHWGALLALIPLIEDGFAET